MYDEDIILSEGQGKFNLKLFENNLGISLLFTVALATDQINVGQTIAIQKLTPIELKEIINIIQQSLEWYESKKEIDE